MNKYRAAADILRDILETERLALLDGDIELVGRLSLDKESILTSIMQLDHRSSPDLQELSKMLRRNQALLQSAMRGMEKVAKHIESLKEVRKGLNTYDRFGNRDNGSTRIETVVERQI